MQSAVSLAGIAIMIDVANQGKTGDNAGGAPTLTEKPPSARVKIVNLALRQHTAKRVDRDVLRLKTTVLVWETDTIGGSRDLRRSGPGKRAAASDKLRASGLMSDFHEHAVLA